MFRLRVPCLLSFACLLLGASAAQSQAVVETYSGTATIDLSMPGTPGAGQTVFGYSFRFDTIDFAPGSVVFGGQPVDFDGQEAAWLASTENGQATLAATAGPTITTAQILGTWSGSHQTTMVQGTANNIQLGPSFSPSNLDVAPGSTYSLDHLLGAVTQPPGLQPPATVLSHRANHTITTIDAINGITHVNVSGTYLLDGPVPTPSRSWSQLKVLLGGLFLFTGLLGSGTTLRRWRRER